MLSVGVTGGAACGKSTVARAIAEALGVFAHSADAIVADLLRGNARLHLALTQRYGASIVREDGVDRARLRELVFTSKEERLFLEGVLHPLVRETWLGHQQQDRAAGRAYFLVEIPLLFETKAQKALDLVLCVGSSPSVQIMRLVEMRGLSATVASGILAAQLGNDERVSQSQLVLWNDGDLPTLLRQVAIAVAQLQVVASFKESSSP